MLPNSLPFLGFLAAMVALFHLSAVRWRMWLLLAASLYFYSTFQPVYLLLIGYSTAVAYVGGRILAASEGRSSHRRWLALGIVAQVLVLGFFKYFNFLSNTAGTLLNELSLLADPVSLPRLEFVLPVGLSFYTFSAISYLIDVSRGKIPAERHAGRLALYIAYFPKLLAGPIERAGAFLSQIDRPRAFDSALFVFGLQLLLWGLFKKVVIADRLAAYVDTGFSMPDFTSPVAVVVAVYLYAFQIYCDFSGYSDMAIGTSAMFGIRLMENFRRPYFSTNVPEFWGKRWHISLMSWFRDYLYIPLGGNRVSQPRWYGNQMIVFLVSGLWHGAAWTFVIWGGLNGLYQVFYFLTGGLRRRLSAPVPGWLWKLLGGLLTFHLITFAWIFFRAESFGNAMSVINRIWGALPDLPRLFLAFPWTGGHALAFGLVAVLVAIESLDELRDMWRWLDARSRVLRWGFFYALIAALLVIGQWNLSEFVYMQF